LNSKNGIFTLSSSKFDDVNDAKYLVDKLKLIDKLGDTLVEKLRRGGIVLKHEKLDHSFKSVACIDGSNTTSENVIKGAEGVFFEVSAAAQIIKNGGETETRVYYNELPFMVYNKYYFGRLPNLVRDCQEYLTAIYETNEYNHDLIVIDGSAYTGSAWWGKVRENMNYEEASLFFDDSLFLEIIEKNLTPLYEEVIELAEKKPFIFMPKQSTVKRLMSEYLEEKYLNLEIMHDQNDVKLLTGKLNEGEYIVFKNTQTLGNPQRHKQIMNDYLNIIFQVDDPRFSHPILFNIHKKWIGMLKELLNFVELYYDKKYWSLIPMERADKAAKKSINSINLRMIRRKFEKSATKIARGDPTIMRKIFQMFRSYRS
jgi:hypothetical protein